VRLTARGGGRAAAGPAAQVLQESKLPESVLSRIWCVLWSG
jgi:hypothetical protein